MRIKKIIIAFFTFLCLAASIYYFFYSSKDNEIAILVPEEGDTKQKPQDPGGIVMPHTGSLVYEKLKGGTSKEGKVHILPEPENPIEIAHNAETSEKFLDSIDDILNNIEYYENELADDSLLNNENLDRTMPIAQKDNENGELLYVPETNLQVVKALDNRYKINRPKVLPGGQEGYKIQLALAYAEADAQKQWQRIKQRHGKILQDANPIFKKVKGKNERIFYLVMAGTYTSLNQAKLVCKKLSHRKQNCIVTK